MLAYCVPQDRAMCVQPWRDVVTRQEINLNIPLQSCLPMKGSVVSAAARALAGMRAIVLPRRATLVSTTAGIP